jgi:hypothetical protein
MRSNDICYSASAKTFANIELYFQEWLLLSLKVFATLSDVMDSFSAIRARVDSLL